MVRMFSRAAFSTLALAAAAASGVAVAGELVEFHIKAGTADGPWNTREEAVEVHLGDTLRFFNDDTIGHRLHTFGKPCPHGEEMAPGQTWDCVIRKPFDATIDGPLWDHDHEAAGKFWVRVL